jgi:hypothetical protein
MRIELKTRTRVDRRGDVRFVMDFMILPRGGANRRYAREMAAKVRQELGEHITRVVIGSSRVTVHFRPSLALMGAINDYCERARQAAQDDPKQLPLFGALAS